MAAKPLTKKLRIKAPVERVWALIEAVERAPEWNPLLKHVIPQKNGGRGMGGTSAFEARVNGLTITGLHEVTTFEQFRQYGAACVAEPLSVSSLRMKVIGKFFLEKTSDNATDLTATLSFEVPRIVAPLIGLAPVQKLLKTSLDNALRNLGRITSAKQ